jgi:hypothetical protein
MKSRVEASGVDAVKDMANIRSSVHGEEGVQSFLQKRKPSWLVSEQP